MIFFQLVILVFIYMINYSIHKKNLFAPAVLLCVFGIVTTGVCILNYTNWNMQTYSFFSLFVIVMAVISFSFVSAVTVKVRLYSGTRYANTNNIVNVERYYAPNWFTVSITVIMIAITLLYYREVSYIANIGKSMYPVKTYSMLWYVKNINTGLRVNTLLSNLTDISYAISYLYIFFLVFNIVYTQKIRPYIIYLLPIVVYAIQTILFGGRTGAMQIVTLALVLFFYINTVRNKNSFTRTIKKNIGKIIIISVIVLVAFFGLNSISGRANTGMSPLYYLSVYIGSGIKNLDTFLMRFTENKNGGFGWETFSGIYTLMARFFGISYDGAVMEYQDRINGLYMGNVYTALRRYYNDFGFLGIIIIPGIVGGILTVYEKRLRNIIGNLQIRSSFISETICIIYGILAYTVVVFFSEDFFFMNILSVNYMLKIFQLIIWNYILLKTGIVKRIG